MSSEWASHVYNTYIFIYPHKKKNFAEITQDVLVATLNCQTVRWGSAVMLWASSFLHPVSGCGMISCMSLYHVPRQSSYMSPNEVAEHTNQNSWVGINFMQIL